MFGYGNFVTIMELHLLPAKSTPLAHFVENNMSVFCETKSSMGLLPCLWVSKSFSLVITFSNIRSCFSLSDGKSLKADTWTRVGRVALASCMSKTFRYRVLVVWLDLKEE